MDLLVQWRSELVVLSASVILALVVSALVARLVHRLLQRLQPAMPAPAPRTRLVRLVVFFGTLVIAVPLGLEAAGRDVQVGIQSDRVVAWLVEPGLQLLLIILLAWLALRVTVVGLERFEAAMAAQTDTTVRRQEQLGRLRTINGLVRNAVNVVVVGVATLMALRELGLDVAPLLTGAGIAGLAIGFGAQNLVRDVISGFFLILEDQVHVGDVVKINGTGGVVESLQLRTMTLRDLSGTVHVFPNGLITQLSNMTKEFAYYVIDLGVAYKEDTDRVVAVLQEVAAGLQTDPEYAPLILEPLDVLGVDEFGDSAVVIKCRIMTRPGKQWTVGRQLRRRIKLAFDAQGIEIPFPHLSIYTGESTKPWPVQPVG